MLEVRGPALSCLYHFADGGSRSRSLKCIGLSARLSKVSWALWPLPHTLLSGVCSALSASLLAGSPSAAVAGLGSVQGLAAAEEDDFLVVKRRDIYDAAPPEPAAAAPGTGLH